MSGRFRFETDALWCQIFTVPDVLFLNCIYSNDMLQWKLQIFCYENIRNYLHNYKNDKNASTYSNMYKWHSFYYFKLTFRF